MQACFRRLCCQIALLSRRLQALAWALLLLVGPLAAGQARVLGSQDCTKCHKPAEKKWRLEEPSQDPKAHAITHKQLADPKALAFARAIGLADPAQPGGRCVECHATVVRGLVRGGVSCESCHGAASAYLDPHDDEPLPESYRKSVQTFGLRDLHAKPAEIARLCVGCHVTPDRALRDAKHPDGANFDAGAGLKKLVHWTAAFTPDNREHASYDYAQVTSAARALTQRALAGGAVSPRTPALGGKSTPAAASSRVLSGSAPVRSAPTQSPLSLFDENVVVQQCPPDCPSDGAPSGPSHAPAGAAVAGAPAARAPHAPRSAPRSIVVDSPLLQPPALEPLATPAVKVAAARSRASSAAALRGRAADLLARLLASGKQAPSLPTPAAPAEFQGPDSELLNLQDLALNLALEALRREPAPASR